MFIRGSHGDFNVNPSECPDGSGPATCTVRVTFTPVTTGMRSTDLEFAECRIVEPGGCAASGSVNIPLRGTGVPMTAHPETIDFGDQAVGTTSAPQQVTVGVGRGHRFDRVVTAGLGAGAERFPADASGCEGVTGPATCTVSIRFRRRPREPRMRCSACRRAQLEA